MRKQAIQQGRSGLLFALKGWPARSSIARVQRGSSEVARCASTEDHQAPSPLLFREQDQATLPLLFQHPTGVGILLCDTATYCELS